MQYHEPVNVNRCWGLNSSWMFWGCFASAWDFMLYFPLKHSPKGCVFRGHHLKSHHRKLPLKWIRNTFQAEIWFMWRRAHSALRTLGVLPLRSWQRVSFRAFRGSCLCFIITHAEVMVATNYRYYLCCDWWGGRMTFSKFFTVKMLSFWSLSKVPRLWVILFSWNISPFFSSLPSQTPKIRKHSLNMRKLYGGCHNETFTLTTHVDDIKMLSWNEIAFNTREVSTKKGQNVNNKRYTSMILAA